MRQIFQTPSIQKTLLKQANKFLAIFIISLFFVQPANASWLDDYMGSAVTTNPSSFQSQKRGYATLGGFTARVPHKSEALMTISMPKVQAGCGGIDMFWGGVSFMNADYLVKKAEGVLKQAPYVLFSLGIKALSTQFGDTMEAVQAIVDQLNSMQIDECGITEGMVSLITEQENSPVAKKINSEMKALSANTEKVKTGVVKDINKGKKETAKDPHAAKLQEVMNKSKFHVKLQKLLTTDGWLLDYMASDDWKALSTNEAKTIRALVGDIEYLNTKSPNVPEVGIVRRIKGCAASLTLEQQIYDKLKIQSKNKYVCEETGESIATRSRITLTSIVNKLKLGNVEYSVDEINFINRSSIPIMTYLSELLPAGSEELDSAVPLLSELVAANYAFGSLENVISNVTRVLELIELPLNETEDLQAYTAPLYSKLIEYLSDLESKRREFRIEYANIVARFNTQYELTKILIENNEEMKKVKVRTLLSRGK